MVRTIITPNNQTVSFSVPKEYIGKQVEVIAFVEDEGLAKETPVKKQVTFNALSIDTKGYKFNRDEANER